MEASSRQNLAAAAGRPAAHDLENHAPKRLNQKSRCKGRRAAPPRASLLGRVSGDDHVAAVRCVSIQELQAFGQLSRH